MEALARYGARRLVSKDIQCLPVDDRWFSYPIKEVPRLDAEDTGERDHFVYSRVRDSPHSYARYVVLGRTPRLMRATSASV